MKRFPFSAVVSLFVTTFTTYSLLGQNVGVGTASPDYRLHVRLAGSSLLKLDNATPLSAGITNDVFFKTGIFYTGGIRTIGGNSSAARLAFLTGASSAETGLLERLTITDNGNVGIGTNQPAAPLHLVSTNGNPVIIDGGSQMYITLAENGNNRGYIGSFAGSAEDVDIGTFTGNATGKMHLTIKGSPALTVDASGEVGIGTISPTHVLHVKDNGSTTALFENIGPVADNVGAKGYCSVSPGYGIGVMGYGGHYGVYAEAQSTGTTNECTGLNALAGGEGNNTGAEGFSIGGTNGIGVYGQAVSASNSNWAGWFPGSTYSNVFSTSDRKLKQDIQPLQNALSIINRLNPSLYRFKTNDYKQMDLPEGIHYGLIADEVQPVLPGIVKKGVQPAYYENNNIHGKKINDPVEFNTINYSEIIPILVGAVKQQQGIIDDQQKKIDELEKRLSAIERKIR